MLTRLFPKNILSKKYSLFKNILSMILFFDKKVNDYFKKISVFF